MKYFLIGIIQRKESDGPVDQVRLAGYRIAQDSFDCRRIEDECFDGQAGLDGPMEKYQVAIGRSRETSGRAGSSLSVL